MRVQAKHGGGVADGRSEAKLSIQPASLQVGTLVRHAKRGLGRVVSKMPDGRTAVLFDDGDVHRYRPDSLAKLQVVEKSGSLQELHSVHSIGHEQFVEVEGDLDSAEEYDALSDKEGSSGSSSAAIAVPVAEAAPSAATATKDRSKLAGEKKFGSAHNLRKYMTTAVRRKHSVRGVFIRLQFAADTKTEAELWVHSLRHAPRRGTARSRVRTQAGAGLVDVDRDVQVEVEIAELGGAARGNGATTASDSALGSRPGRAGGMPTAAAGALAALESLELDRPIPPKLPLPP